MMEYSTKSTHFQEKYFRSDSTSAQKVEVQFVLATEMAVN